MFYQQTFDEHLIDFFSWKLASNSIQFAHLRVIQMRWVRERFSFESKQSETGKDKTKRRKGGMDKKLRETKPGVCAYQMATTNKGFVSQQGHAEHCKDNCGMHKAEQINRLSQKIMRRNDFFPGAV